MQLTDGLQDKAVFCNDHPNFCLHVFRKLLQGIIPFTQKLFINCLLVGH